MEQEMTRMKALFEFTDDDLAANRAGRLSEEQRAVFRTTALNASIDKAAFTLSLPLIPLIIIVYFVVAWRYGNALGPLVLVMIAVWLGLMYAIVRAAYGAARSWLRRSALTLDHPMLRWLGRLDGDILPALEHGRVERIAGPARFPTDGEHEFVTIGDEALTSSVSVGEDERLWKLTPDQPYAVYYVPSLLWIASVEPLPTPPDPPPKDDDRGTDALRLGEPE